ncbi:MAG: hypothetical protein ACW99G_03070 [Candidatus Thorarchaeota archaeon]|jgi:hypothetical protein
MEILEIQENECLDGLDEFYDQDFVKDLSEVARQEINQFFHDKELSCGGPICEGILYAPTNIVLVLNTTMSNGVKTAFKSIDYFSEKPEKPEKPETGAVTEEMKMVLSILNHASERQVPKEHAAGIMLMFLEICRGIQIFELSPDEIVIEPEIF